MGHVVRTITSDERRPLFDLLGFAFGEESTQEGFDDEMLVFELERAYGVDDDGKLVGSGAIHSFDLVVPGGRRLPCAGVTWISVLPTHRRRGILRDLMARQLDDMVERGEPLAALTASEAGIYPRFGYGLAARSARVVLDTSKGLPLASPPATTGSLDVVRADEALAALPAVWDASAARRPGEVSRSAAWWDMWAKDRERNRDGATPRYFVLHRDDDGAVDGAASFRRKEGVVAGSDVGTMTDAQVAGTSSGVEHQLLSFLATVDLTSAVTCRRPLDDPFRHRLADWREYRVDSIADWLWVRVLDVPAALSARSWGASGALRVRVHDTFRPDLGGTFLVEAGDDGTGTCARVEATAADVEVEVDSPGLASLYLGDVTPTTLAAAGRLTARDDDARRRADRLFATDRLPFCSTGF